MTMEKDSNRFTKVTNYKDDDGDDMIVVDINADSFGMPVDEAKVFVAQMQAAINQAEESGAAKSLVKGSRPKESL